MTITITSPMVVRTGEIIHNRANGESRKAVSVEVTGTKREYFIAQGCKGRNRTMFTQAIELSD